MGGEQGTELPGGPGAAERLADAVRWPARRAGAWKAATSWRRLTQRGRSRVCLEAMSPREFGLRVALGPLRGPLAVPELAGPRRGRCRVSRRS